MAVLYASDYGFSDRLSQTLARGITKAGVATDMVDLLSADPQVRPGRARAPRLAPGCSATQAPPWANVRTRCLLVGCSIRVSCTTGRLR